MRGGGKDIRETCFVVCGTTASLIPFFQGTLGGWRRRGWKKKCWTDNVKERTSLSVLELLAIACEHASCMWNHMVH